MQIVIDIPDEIYKDIESRDWKNPIWARDSLMRYIHEGVVLPKHHGRLIDADELKEWVENWLYKDRYYHNGRVSKTIPVTELYDILEQISMEVEE